MRRLLRWAAALTGAVLVLAVGTVGWLGWSSLPKLSGELTLPALAAPVEVVRDRWGIPHLRAESVSDAYRAMGFLHAQDRLWQMELNRLVGQGRLAEVVGADALPTDRFMRMLGLARAAESSLGHLDEGARRLLEAYAEGVNGFLTLGGTLPPEFLILRHRPEPWRAADSVLFLKLMALDLTSSWRQDLYQARLAARLSPEQLVDLSPEATATDPVTYAASMRAVQGLTLADDIGPGLPVGALGSNEWVVAGSRTKSGVPLLANDPHLRLTAPGIWYLAHIEAPGLSVIGATLPAVPFVVLGRNREIAWGFTNTGSDVQDLFVETVDPAAPGRYLAPSGSEPFIVRDEEIRVRDAAPVTLRVRETRHGPVLSDVVPAAALPDGRVMALAWTGLDPADRTAEAGFKVATAADWSGFVAAFEDYAAPQQNIAYADRAGHIGMLSPGRVPVRAQGDGRLPLPGATGAFDWTGTIPYPELPRTLDPAQGFILNANNRLVGERYPHFLAAAWEPPYRARRIQEVLEAVRPLDRAASQKLQLDQLSVFSRELTPGLLAEAATGPLREALLAWDGTMAADRPLPLVFAAWYRELGPLVWADELGPLAQGTSAIRPDALARMLTQRQVWCDDVATKAIESCDERSRLALDRSLAWLRDRHGANWKAWRWDSEHQALMEHRAFERVPLLRLLFSLRVPTGGSGTTVNVGAYSQEDPEHPFVSGHGPSYRAQYDLADPDGSVFVATTGQSGHPLSSHYRDMIRLWRDGLYVPMSMDPAAYAAELSDRLVLSPSPR